MAERSETVAWLVGASGLSGGLLLEALLEAPDFARIYAVTRRPLSREHPRLANRIVPFEQLEGQLRGAACTTAFCCLGASRNAAPEEARAVDLECVLAFARAAKAAGAGRFVYLSCAGALQGPRKPGPHLKREAEAALEALGFASLDILQPGPLLAVRRELRPADLVLLAAAPFVNLASFGARTPRRSVSARTVAGAMLGAARTGRRGVYRYTYSAIRTLAGAKYRASPVRTNAPGSVSRRPPA